MSTKGPEGKKTQEQKSGGKKKNDQVILTDEEKAEKEFIEEFTRMSDGANLRRYEEKHRDRINQASWPVRDAFDKVWERVTSRRYWQPETTAPVRFSTDRQNITDRTDPKGRNYRTNILFSTIKWRKLRRRKGGKGGFRDEYMIDGIEMENGDERPLYQNLSPHRLKQLIGDENAEKIFKDIRETRVDHGELHGKFDLNVEGYWEVIFQPRSHINDERDVRVYIEGFCLQVQRNKRVIVPGFHLEAADNSLEDRYEETPQKGRKKVATVQKFPYTALREATRREFLMMFAQGNKIQREAIAKAEND